MIKEYITKEEVKSDVEKIIDYRKKNNIGVDYIEDKYIENDIMGMLYILLSESESRIRVAEHCYCIKGIWDEDRYNRNVNISEQRINKITNTINLINELEIARNYGY